MSDRYKGLVVALDRDYRDDDAQAIIEAIKMIKGVAAVTPELATMGDWLARQRVKAELRSSVAALFASLDNNNVF